MHEVSAFSLRRQLQKRKEIINMTSQNRQQSSMKLLYQLLPKQDESQMYIYRYDIFDHGFGKSVLRTNPSYDCSTKRGEIYAFVAHMKLPNLPNLLQNMHWVFSYIDEGRNESGSGSGNRRFSGWLEFGALAMLWMRKKQSFLYSFCLLRSLYWMNLYSHLTLVQYSTRSSANSGCITSKGISRVAPNGTENAHVHKGPGEPIIKDVPLEDAH